MENRMFQALEEAFKGLASYSYKFPTASNDELTGDLYTRLNRCFKSYGLVFYLSRSNFHSIRKDMQGKIVSIGFTASTYGSNSEEIKKQIEEIKSYLSTGAFDFNLYTEEVKLSNIINQVTNYQIL